MEIKFPKITDMGKNKIVGFISLKKYLLFFLLILYGHYSVDLMNAWIKYIWSMSDYLLGFLNDIRNVFKKLLN